MKKRNERIETIFNNFHSIRRAYSEGSRFSSRHFGISIPQASVIMMLGHQGRQTMGQIAAVIGISKSAATQLLEGLVEQNFVERTTDKNDRRVVYVELSKRGLRHLSYVRRKGIDSAIQMFNQLNDEELEQVEAITIKLVEGAKNPR